ncbi:TPA: hypothetical protein ENG04_01515 [Candidatus Poribacteria bacterium]|nr:hypothetical protein [Candidatus Poribacteria bacterium]HEX28739.1 hypothetical protein [Candidatus Poribacteria bacterium]
MILEGRLVAETPIYRGNSRRVLFTRDGDGTHRLVSLAGEVAGTAQSLMDAFIGRSRDGRNIGLLDRMWRRLYGSPIPEGLITEVRCELRDECYPRDRFFDLRMGIKLDEDRWAAEANANYKIETLFRHSVFDFTMQVNDWILRRDENQAKLYYLLQELKEGRFWFGGGKSKGLGRCRLEMDIPFSPPSLPKVSPGANHLTIFLSFSAVNPILVGWNWGRVTPELPSFIAIEGRLLLEGIRDLPEPIRDRLSVVIGGPILSPEDWKKQLSEYLPRVIAAWLREQSSGEKEFWVLSSSALGKLGRGKYGLSKKLLESLEPFVDQPFSSLEEAEEAFKSALGKKANMAKRVINAMEHKVLRGQEFNTVAWLEVAKSIGLNPSLSDSLAERMEDEAAMVEILSRECRKILPRFFQQVDQQVKLIQSDSWVDEEVAKREEHIKIKMMLLNGEIDEREWSDPDFVPKGITPAIWEEFVESHRRVRFRYLLNPRNLRKSITNDRNYIAFIKAYRDKVRLELAQPYNMDFRQGGPSNREISRRYGKPYDRVFTRMLTWSPSAEREGWEIYIPGSTIKGAFRKRASQVLRTIRGESRETEEVLDNLFGTQGRRALVFFSDAYLVDPDDLERAWCSMDGVRMDPRTGRPIEDAKADYLFAYGENLIFRFRMDIQDISEENMEEISLLLNMIRDFQNGDIPLGGEKTNGLGWVNASVTELQWLTTDPNGVGKKLFGERDLTRDGIWYKLELEGEEAEAAIGSALKSLPSLSTERSSITRKPPLSKLGFISHRAFGGRCGVLHVEGEVLSPINIKESGEPSFKTTLNEQPVNGWDFFSVSPPDASLRGNDKIYALPSKSIKGTIRHIYSIATNSKEQSPDITRLNPADSLFGWVGTGPNQAIMGRISFSFGIFDKPELAWFKVPFFYGEWQYTDGEWKQVAEGETRKLLIDDTWRIFPHVPLAPIVERIDDFNPDTPQADYFRAIMPGSKCRFTIRFWNLEEQELQRLIWCLILEDGLAHKMGKLRYLGFGSIKFRILPTSYFIDWSKRYAGKPENEWRLPIDVEELINTEVIEHYEELRRALNVERI